MEAKIITIVGGGSTYTPGVVKAILSKKDTFTVKETFSDVPAAICGIVKVT